MSWSAVRAAFEANVDWSAKLVLVALAYRTNPEGQAWPLLATVCADTGLSDRAVRNAVHRLEEAGLVEVFHRQGRSSVFHLNPGTSCREVRHLVPVTPAPGADIIVKEPVKERGSGRAHPPGCPCQGTGWLETWDSAMRALTVVTCPGPQP